MAEAESHVRGYTKVQIAYDLMELMIPRRCEWGFETYPDQDQQQQEPIESQAVGQEFVGK